MIKLSPLVLATVIIFGFANSSSAHHGKEHKLPFEWSPTLHGITYHEEELGVDVFCGVSPKSLLGQCWDIAEIHKHIENKKFLPESFTPQSGIGLEFKIFKTIVGGYVPELGDGGSHFFCGVETKRKKGKCWRLFDIEMALKGEQPNQVPHISKKDIFIPLVSI